MSLGSVKYKVVVAGLDGDRAGTGLRYCEQKREARNEEGRTRKLVSEKIEAEGVSIGSADKVLAVSTILSRAKEKFKSDRAAGGWVLVKPHQEETPQGAPTPAGF